MPVQYIVKHARAPGDNNLPRLPEILAECPTGYRLHSVVPVASGGGYTLYQQVIFEASTVTSQDGQQ